MIRVINKSDQEKLVQTLVALFESQQQADGDFCGEQREWHLPRLNKAALGVIELFPIEAAMALEKAKRPGE